MKYILGKKIGMSQMLDSKGNVTPVTVIEAGPCVVTQVKAKKPDGYEAVQIGFGVKKNLTKPLMGHFNSRGNFRWVREFREPFANKNEEKTGKNGKSLKVGDKIDASVFQEGDRVKVSGISKGKGFQGVVKRHGFHGMDATHGTKHHERAPGSIGSAFPEKVFKGMKMAGRMGSDRVSVKNLKVVKVDPENNIIAVSGAIPGHRGTLIEIRLME